MGAILSAPVTSTVTEQHTHPKFRVASSELNGWRSNMEDAHLVYPTDEWGFFGVFDGHGGTQCSQFVAKELRKELDADGCPPDDAAVKKLLFKVDDAFLGSDQESGTTAAMCIVHPTPTGPRLRVVNAGDSRVILGRRDGSIVDGGGTDQGLSTDHKPNEPGERERILRCGGTVEAAAGGVHRVNGDLAVSRGFGDRNYKKCTTGLEGPENKQVTVDPELKEFTAGQADFLLIVCDGVSEGDFPNPDVVKVAAQWLKDTNDDLGAVARHICLRSVKKNSKDNVSCMIVTFDQDPGRATKSWVDFVPGPIPPNPNGGWIECYETMAKRADKTLAEAAEMRYERVKSLVADAQLLASTDEDGSEPGERTAKELEDKRAELQAELQKLEPPPGADRKAHFAGVFARDEPEAGSGGGGGGLDMQAMMQSNPQLMMQMMQMMQQRQMGAGLPEDGRKVKCAPLAALKAAVEAHQALKWDARMETLAGEEGIVKQDDTDGTSQVRFPSQQIAAWLPTSVLTDL